MMRASLSSIASIRASESTYVTNGRTTYQIQIWDIYNNSLVISFFGKWDFDRFQQAIASIETGQQINIAEEAK